MTRSRVTALSVALSVLVAVGPVSWSAASQEIAAWLERRELTALLAVHLEQQFEQARDAPTREQLAGRLARVYARMLEAGTDDAAAVDLETRGRRLLTAVSGSEADELRLALLGATHRAAARIAERRRLAIDDPGECDTARASLERILPELRDLRGSLRRSQIELQRRLTRAAGVEATLLVEQLERVQRHAAQAAFVSAWTMYYLTWLGDCAPDDRARGGGPSPAGARDLLREANRLFVELLDTGLPAPEPSDVSLDLRRREPFARAILGIALCESLDSTPTEADGWIDLLEAGSTYAPLRAELPAWRLATLLDGGRAIEANERFESMLVATPDLPVPWLRLAAAGAIHLASASRHASEMAQRAIGALAARGEVAQVLDLARRFDRKELFGAEGFVLRYVRGLRAFEAARAADPRRSDVEGPAGADADSPDRGQATRSVRDLYGVALGELTSAVAEPDASTYGEAVAAADALIGWCHWYRGEFGSAVGAFERAAQAQAGENAAESLWMAIAASEQLARRGEREAEVRLAQLSDRFLERFPGSPRVPQLLLRRSLAVERPTPELVDQLLAVPPGSETYGPARRRAVQVLYELFRAETGPGRSETARSELARRLVAIAARVVESDAGSIADLEPAERAGHAIRLRQLIEVSLDPGVARPELALATLDALDALTARDLVDLSTVRAELAFRRIQATLAGGDGTDFAAAERMAVELDAIPGSEVWRVPAARLLFRGAVERRRADPEANAGSAGAPSTRWLRPIVEWGRRSLGELDTADGDALAAALRRDGSLAGSVAILGEAVATVAEVESDPDLARDAARWLEALLVVRPADAMALRSAAIARDVAGDPAAAIEHLRRLVAGAAIGSELWYEGKWRHITALARIDPRRAREVLEQHRAFEPELGPAPWGERLRELDRRLPALDRSAS